MPLASVFDKIKSERQAKRSPFASVFDKIKADKTVADPRLSPKEAQRLAGQGLGWTAPGAITQPTPQSQAVSAVAALQPLPRPKPKPWIQALIESNPQAHAEAVGAAQYRAQAAKAGVSSDPTLAAYLTAVGEEAKRIREAGDNPAEVAAWRDFMAQPEHNAPWLYKLGKELAQVGFAVTPPGMALQVAGAVSEPVETAKGLYKQAGSIMPWNIYQSMREQPGMTLANLAMAVGLGLHGVPKLAEWRIGRVPRAVPEVAPPVEPAPTLEAMAAEKGPVVEDYITAGQKILKQEAIDRTNSLQSYRTLKVSRAGWQGTVTKPGRFLSDTAAIIDTKLANKAKTDVLEGRVDKNRGRGAKQEFAKKVWDSAVERADHPGEIIGTDIESGTAYVLRQDQTGYLPIDAYKLRQIESVTDFDSIRMGPHDSPIVFYRGNKPVAGLMPRNINSPVVKLIDLPTVLESRTKAPSAEQTPVTHPESARSNLIGISKKSKVEQKRLMAEQDAMGRAYFEATQAANPVPVGQAPVEPANVALNVGDVVETVQEGKTIRGKVVHPQGAKEPYVLLNKGPAGSRRWAVEGNDWTKVETAPKASVTPEPAAPAAEGVAKVAIGEVAPGSLVKMNPQSPHTYQVAEGPKGRREIWDEQGRKSTIPEMQEVYRVAVSAPPEIKLGGENAAQAYTPDVGDLVGKTRKLTGKQNFSGSAVVRERRTDTYLLETARGGTVEVPIDAVKLIAPANRSLTPIKLGGENAAQAKPFVKSMKVVKPFDEITRTIAEAEPTTLYDKLDALEKKLKSEMQLPKGPQAGQFDIGRASAIGAIKIAKGAVKFAEWSEQMVKDFGEAIRPHLAAIYKQSRDYYERNLKGAVATAEAGGRPPASTIAAPVPGREGPLPKYAGNLNLERMNTPIEAKRHILQQVNELSLDPQWKARTGRITHQQTREAAESLGMTVEDVRNIRPGQALNNAEITALRDLHQYYDRSVRDAEAQHATDPTEANTIEILERTNEYRIVMQATRGGAAEMGRGLAAHKIMAEARRSAEISSGDIFKPLRETVDPTTKGYGNRNVLFTRQRADVARLRLQEKMARLATGIPVDMIGDLVEIGGYHVEAGLREFGPWRNQMAGELGEKFKPYLKETWDRLQSEAGKRAQSKNALRAMALKQKAYKIIENSFGGKEMSDEIIKGLALIPEGDSIGLAKFVRDSSKAKTMEQLHAYLYGNMLSSPLTHIKNAINNTMFLLQNIAMRAPYAGVDAAISRLTGRERAYYLKEVVPAAVGAGTGLPQGLRRAASIMEHGWDMDQVANLDLSGGAELRGLPGNTKPLIIGGKMILPPMPHNPWNLIRRAMVAADVITKEMARESQLMADSAHKAIAESKGRIVGQELAENIARIRNTATPEMLEKADRFAQYSTYQAEMGSFAKQVVKLRNVEIPGRIPVVGGLQPGRLIVPFIQVGTNMLKIGAEYSPLGIFKLADPVLRASPELAEVVAKSAVGSAVIAGLMGGAESGVIHVTGAPPKSKAERDLWYQSGRQPYSVKIGNKWVPYQWLGQFGYPLAITAAFSESWREDGAEPTQDRVVDALGSIGRFTLDQSYFQGLNSLMQALSDPEYKLESLLGNIATQGIPLSSLSRTATQVIDPLVRDVQGVYDRVRSNIPGVSYTLPPRLNTLGQSVKRGSRTGVSALWPFSPSYVNTDPVVVELVRLRVVPGFAGKQLTVNEKKTKLTHQQWRDYQKLIGGAIQTDLKKLVSGDGYALMNDQDKQDALLDTIRRARDDARGRYKRSLGDKGSSGGGPSPRLKIDLSLK